MMPIIRPIKIERQPVTGYRREQDIHAEMARGMRKRGALARLVAAARARLGRGFARIASCASEQRRRGRREGDAG